MKQTTNILSQLPPTAQTQLAAALAVEQQEIMRQMGQAQGLQDVGRAQGKFEVVSVLLAGLGQVGHRGHFP